MRRYFISCLCLLFLAGCASTSGSDSAKLEQQEVAQAQVEPMQPEPAPVEQKKGKKSKKKESTKKVQYKPKSEAQIRQELDATARSLLTRASHTITPSKHNKRVTQTSKGYVATYISVDPTRYTTDMRPASKHGQYSGFVRYSEDVYECTGKTRAEALKAECHQVRSKRMNEMIHFDGTKWAY